MLRISLCFVVSALFLDFGDVAASDTSLPNIVMVLLDDAGWTDVGWNGSDIDTPHIDKLATQGMRFTDCHSAAPNCSPSRAGLLTGRIPPRAGIYSYLPSEHVMHLREDEVTIAELLKTKGYRTGHFGKWHLSRLGSNQPGPARQGFDYSLGTDNNASPSHLNPSNFIRNGVPVGETAGYSCQLVVDETIGWLRRNHGVGNEQSPFFACVWFHEPHTPIASPPELIRKYQKRDSSLSKKTATYYANIENADRAIGRLIDELDKMEVSDDTLVFFTSDNGPLNRFSRRGLRGQKSNVWEGGHRVPGIIRWPGQVSAGEVCREPISGIDFLPTVCELTKIDLPRDRTIDGESLVPLLFGKAAEFQRQRPLYWFFYRLNPAVAIREGNWSLVAMSSDAHRPKSHPLVRADMLTIRNTRPTDFQLFDLSTDLAQRVNIEDQPQVFADLRAKMEDLHQSVVKEGYQWDIPSEYGAASKRRIWNSE